MHRAVMAHIISAETLQPRTDFADSFLQLCEALPVVRRKLQALFEQGNLSLASFSLATVSLRAARSRFTS